ncbi:MAG TPA: hypothetical protein VGY57_05215, partial [Vicinamibacterales bacterium]|nr:hypothetical protein [Vicinamibacterales bacterium]
SALGDDAAAPRYVRTVPKKGYEFVCPLNHTNDEGHEATKTPRRSSRAVAIAAAAVLLTIAGAFAVRALTAPKNVPIVAVVRFDNETGDASLARFADNLTDTVTVQLTQASNGRFGVIGSAAILRRPRQERDLRTIAASLNAGFIVLGQVQRDQQRVRVLAHLIRMPEQTHLAVSRTENVAEASLTVTDEIAGKIARTFGATLRDPATAAQATFRDSRAAATR